MTTKQVMFGKINSLYLELRKLYGFYDTDIWERFDNIPSYEAEDIIGQFASIVPGMDANSLLCFKLIFDWIEVAKNQVKPIDPKYTLPKKIETGKRYRIISSTREWYALCIEDESANLNVVVSIRKPEEIVREWEEFIRTQKQQVDLLSYRMGM